MGTPVIACRRTAAYVVLASLAALLAPPPSPALADAATFADRRFDTRHPADIVAVRVVHADPVVVVVHHRNLTFRDSPASIRVAYDTGPRFSGPEFWLRIRYQTDQSVDLRTTRGWARPAATPIPTCLGERVSVSAKENTTRISVPRSCYGNPGTIRVHVRVNLRPADTRDPDVAPRSRTMGPAVHF
jgi:hypothetical protein